MKKLILSFQGLLVVAVLGCSLAHAHQDPSEPSDPSFKSCGGISLSGVDELGCVNEIPLGTVGVTISLSEASNESPAPAPVSTEPAYDGGE